MARACCISSCKPQKMDEAVRRWSVSIFKSVLKDNSPMSVLRAMFGVLSAHTPNGDLEDFYKNNQVQKTLQTLQVMANNLPPEEFLRNVLELIKPGFRSNDAHRRKAACLMVGVMASEPENRQTNVLWKPRLKYFLKGISDRHPVVLNAAFFCFRKFVNLLLKVGVDVYSRKVFPVIEGCIFNLFRTWDGQRAWEGEYANHKNFTLPPHISDFYLCVGRLYAQDLCAKENEDEPYSLSILSILLTTIRSSYHEDIRIEIFKTVEHTMHFTHMLGISRFFTYFELYVHQFVENDLGLGSVSLQVNVLGVVEQLLGRIYSSSASFRDDDGDVDVRAWLRPLALDGLILVGNLFDKAPKSSAVEMIGQFLIKLYDYDHLLKTRIDYLLERVVTRNIQILKQEDESEEVLDSLRNAEPDNVDSKDKNDDGYVYPSNSVGRKERACALFIKFLEPSDKGVKRWTAFDRYIDITFQQLTETTAHREGRVRGQALKAISLLCSLLDDDCSQLQGMVNFLLPRCANILVNDTDERALKGVSEAVRCLFSYCYGVTLTRDVTQALVYTLERFFSSQTKYQISLQDGPLNLVSGSFEDCEPAIFNCCVSIFEILGEKLPEDEYAEIFERLYPIMLSKMEDLCMHKNMNPESYALKRRLTVLSKNCGAYAEKIVPVLIRCCSVKANRLRSNALHALAVYIYYGKLSTRPYYAEILMLLQNVLGGETTREDLDAVCIAIAGMIATDTSSIPLNEMVHILFNHLPLDCAGRGRSVAYCILIDCFSVLYKLDHPIVKEHIALITEVVVYIGTRKSKCSHKNTTALALLQSINKDFSEVFEEEMVKFSHAIVTKLQKKINAIP